MNLTLSVPENIARKAKAMAARKGKSLSAWFREKVETEERAERLQKAARIDPETAAALGSALPLEEHPGDSRWQTLVKKHLK